MHVIEARNIQGALIQGLWHLKAEGRKRGSRNGEVLVVDGPVTTNYVYPRERVLFWPARDANPFFHLFESLWMLAGQNEVAPLTHYVGRMKDFSDDGVTLQGAYGHRWTQHFHFDQLKVVIQRLMLDPDDRRCVLQMWDCQVDLDSKSRDIPCNTHIYFTRDYLGRLDMMVSCRSNDIIWGAYGANAVHFSMLQEFMAAGIGCAVGRYWQVSNNFHAYTKVFDPLFAALSGPAIANPYNFPVTMNRYPLVSIDLEEWRNELYRFVLGQHWQGFTDPFFKEVADPMQRAYGLYRKGELDAAIDIVGTVRAQDWCLAGAEWLERRRDRRDNALYQAAPPEASGDTTAHIG